MPCADTKVDVLIIGAGAAGMMAATCAAAYGLETLVIDKRPEPLIAGHGDSLNPRSLEILESLGLADRMLREGSFFIQWARWAPDSDGALHRTSIKSWNQYDSCYTNITLTQAKIGEIMTEHVRERSDTEIRRGTIVESLAVNDGEDYPVEIRTRDVKRSNNGDAPSAQAENDIRVDDDEDLLRTSTNAHTICAKYVVACDGAHSWTRRQLGIDMVGDDSDIIWGVMDVVIDTDFPSPRIVNTVQGAGFGLLMIPRERGLNRVYTTLAMVPAEQTGKLEREKVTRELICETIQQRLKPYRFSYQSCEWWAAYQIGQRVSTANIDRSGRVFLAGDAVHTHSPQAGQGMNVSIQDIWNLMWKLNLVVKGTARSDILRSYTDERLKVAQDLVDFDRQYAAMASGRPTPPGLFAKQTWSMQEFFERIGVMIAGLHIQYKHNALTCTTKDDVEQAQKALGSGNVPPGLVVGMRLKPATVYRHEDALEVQLTGFKALPSNGRFQILLFIGDIGEADKLEGLQDVARKLSALQARYVSSLFNTVLLHTANITDLALANPISKLRTTLGSIRIFFDGHLVDGELVSTGAAYKTYHVDPEAGKLVVLRPDLYIAYVGSVMDVDSVERYFDGFLIPKTVV